LWKASVLLAVLWNPFVDSALVGQTMAQATDLPGGKQQTIARAVHGILAPSHKSAISNSRVRPHVDNWDVKDYEAVPRAVAKHFYDESWDQSAPRWSWKTSRDLAFAEPPSEEARKHHHGQCENMKQCDKLTDSCGKKLVKEFGQCKDAYGGKGCVERYGRPGPPGPCWGDIKKPEKATLNYQKDINQWNVVKLTGRPFADPSTKCRMEAGWRLAVCRGCDCKKGLVRADKFDQLVVPEDNPEVGAICAAWFIRATATFANMISNNKRTPAMAYKVTECYKVTAKATKGEGVKTENVQTDETRRRTDSRRRLTFLKIRPK